MFTILPPAPLSSMYCPASCESRNTAVRLTAISSFQASSGYESAGALRMTPALFTRMSIEPNSAKVFSMRLEQACAFAKSAEK